MIEESRPDRASASAAVAASHGCRRRYWRLASLSFSVIRLRPALSATVPEVGSWARVGRREPPVDGAAQYSKACDGATHPWVQIPPPPPLTCRNYRIPGVGMHAPQF